MRVFSWLFLWCAVLPVSIIAEALSLTDAVEALPKCAATCLTTALANSTCSPTDQQCICTNAPLNTELNVCVMVHCTVKEALTTQNVTSVACNAPYRDKGNFYTWISNSFVIVSWVAYLLRITSRFISDTNFWWDDYMATAVMIIGIPSSVINVQGLSAHGLGKDIWTLSFKDISDMIRFFYASEILYFAQVSFVKISILLFFLRLFPERKIRVAIWCTIILNGVILVLFDLLAVFQCRPISFYWKRWDNEHVGTCLNINILAFSSAGQSIVLDIWMLILPLTQLYDLNLHWKKKVGVGAMLGIGILITIVSVLRLKSLVHFANTQNPTWDYLEVGYWSTIEICVGIICSSMPALRLLLVRIFPRFASTTHNSSNHSKTHGNDPSKRRSSIPKIQFRNAYRRETLHSGGAGGPGITMKKTFEVVSNQRGGGRGGFDAEMGEEDGTELVHRPGTKDSEQRVSFEYLGSHLSSPLDGKGSQGSVDDEGELGSPRNRGWV
ncbi:1d51a128-50f8-45a5-af4c-dc505450d2dd [Sclerotinia trifoliorum]|uniref:1d51a128-50f8-45a5-af4c-dc505450d2dd n=1 Tax=Sclerotinia trifoliorum TaxID=28548 RepID=A0A8H2W375_9HELO|nr:1d51a128-50f8-45a5-af4c-dc505450d2dd [Sclerotinia trifoliorum]